MINWQSLLASGVKAHEAFELSGSESEEEGEYTDNRVVYDSSDDSEADSDFELNEKSKLKTKKMVLLWKMMTCICKKS